MKKTITALVSCLTVISNATVLAEQQDNWFYRTPQTPIISEQDLGLNCRQLEREIRDITHLTYSYKPHFYDDPLQGTAALVTGMFGAPALVVPAYAGWVEFEETKRINKTQERLDALRQLKAEKRCFVS